MIYLRVNRTDARLTCPRSSNPVIPASTSTRGGASSPAGTPRAIVDRINADVAEVLKSPDMQAQFKSQGADILISSPDAFMRLLEADVQKWAEVVKASGAHID